MTTLIAEYTAKSGYDNFREYFLERLFKKNMLFPLLLSFMCAVFFSGIEIVNSAVPFTMQSLLGFSLKYSLALVLVFAFLAFGMALTVWKQKMQLYHDRIADASLIRKDFAYSDIVRIILLSPNIARIEVKKQGEKYTRGLYWFGREEKEWLAFLKQLEQFGALIDEKLFVEWRTWLKFYLIKANRFDSYSLAVRLKGK